MRALLLSMAVCLFSLPPMHSIAQPDRWQQRVRYRMDVDMDVRTNRFTGKQVLDYWNNSPDTLKVLYYHLYWNAFQPGSMMDVRSRELGRKSPRGRADWDGRVRDRISKLSPEEIGYQRVRSLKLNGRPQKMEEHETILKVLLDRPIPPRSKVTLDMDFEAQVPVQIRRSGRDNAEGVRYSMAQWYPKLCEYDYEGWHPTPYVAREFYGVWGDYEVNIRIDKAYVIGGTGYLQNPQEIGHGYENPSLPLKRPAGERLTWRFTAPNVHDFVWAADPEYRHLSRKLRDDLTVHTFFHISEADERKRWEAFPENVRRQLSFEQHLKQEEDDWLKVLDVAEKALPFMEKHFGRYPYRQYSFIQGGDGGMEYPMATLLKDGGAGTVIHEWMHSWYQMMLGTNESLHAWMDEGFTSWATARVSKYLAGDTSSSNPHLSSYLQYISLAKTEFHEPLTTHADHYNTNFGYSTNAYTKGQVFLEQLGYVVGAKVLDSIMMNYYRRWRFKHPNPTDFIRVAEDVSGLQLDWYRNFFVNTTKTIDYGIDSLWEDKGRMQVRLKNTGTMPMPIDVLMTFKDGSRELAYIPQYLMFGGKANEQPELKRTVCTPWRWTHPTYVFEIDRRLTDLKSIEIDPSQRMADMERKNNRLELNW